MPFLRTLLKFTFALFLILIGVLGVSYLQERFDEGDKKKAIAAIQMKFLHLSDCRTEVISRFRGHVHVQCGERKWVVDVVKGTIEEKF